MIFKPLLEIHIVVNDLKKIFWIASYPKSGNTWIRLILSGIFFTKDGNLENLKILDKIPKFDIFENYEFIKKISFNDYKKIFNHNVYNEEAQIALAKYWIEAQKKINYHANKFKFFKTHNARLRFKNYYYTNQITSLGFIYIIRDPRDVIVSYSKWKNSSIEYTVNFLLNNNIMGTQNTKNRMPEFIYNWKDHYKSWKNFIEVPSLFIKYEDLLNDIDFEINRIIEFFYKNYNIKIDNKNIKIKNIIKSTKFENLQKIENDKGFNEQSEHTIFFRKGKKNQWKNKLAKNHENLIKKNFEKEMIQLKYI